MTATRDEKGAAVVEFAVLLLLLLVIIFGIAEYGFLWLQAHYVESSAREGARVGARVATLATPPTALLNLDSAVRPAVEGAVKESLAGLYGSRVDELVSNIEITGPGSEPLPAVKVRVTVDSSAYWTPVVWSLLALLPGVSEKTGIDSLSASAAFAIEPH